MNIFNCIEAFGRKAEELSHRLLEDRGVQKRMRDLFTTFGTFTVGAGVVGGGLLGVAEGAAIATAGISFLLLPSLIENPNLLFERLRQWPDAASFTASFGV